MITLSWPWVLVLFPIPWIVRLFRKPVEEVSGSSLRVPFFQDLMTLDAGGPTVKSHSSVSGKFWLAFVIWTVLLLAAARPQWIGEPVALPVSGRDLMMAVDISGSMETPDMRLHGRSRSRLAVTKKIAGNFIQQRVGDRVGLILFGSQAYLQTPLTFDRTTVEQLLSETVIGLVGDSTAIGDAIGLAAKRFSDKPNVNKVLILLTDGQNTAGNITPEQAKELAINKGVKVYTIGVGADKMLIQSFFGSRQVNPSQELDEDMLTDIATSTGGQYFRARNAQELQAIYQQLDALEPIEGETRKMRPLTALFYYPLTIALALSILWALVLVLKSIVDFFQYRRSDTVTERGNE